MSALAFEVSRMTDLDLAAIRARAEAATKGPWEVCAFDSGHSKFEMSVSVITESAGDRICDMDGLGRTWNEIDARDDGMADAEFIAHAREDIPALLAELDRLNATIGRVRDIHAPIDALDFGVNPRGNRTKVCIGCGQDNGNWNYWPCDTICALEGGEQ